MFDALKEIRPNNVQHEYYLTEVPELMVKKGMKVETYHIEDGNDLRGVNTLEDMAVCEKILKKEEESHIHTRGNDNHCLVSRFSLHKKPHL